MLMHDQNDQNDQKRNLRVFFTEKKLKKANKKIEDFLKEKF